MEDPLHGENDTQLPGFLAGDESSAIWGPGPDEGLARHCTQPGSETHCPAARPWSSTDSKDNVSLAVNHRIPPRLCLHGCPGQAPVAHVPPTIRRWGTVSLSPEAASQLS